MTPRGYIHGDTAAAKYLGLKDRKGLRRWQDDPTLPLRELLTPRIINGHRYYKVANLDRFMDPALNTPASATRN
jgi:hypothetical protein